MNIELTTKAKNDFEKAFFKLTNNSVFGKTMENLRKHRDIKLVTTGKRRNQLLSQHNYHKWFSERLLALEMKKIKVKMNKPVYLGLSLLEFSKTLMYEFWYNFIKPKYQQNGKLCYMDTESIKINIKTEDVYRDFAGKNKKVVGLMKDELGGTIMTEFVVLRPESCSYLIFDVNTDKKTKGTKKYVIKEYLNLMIIKIAY